MFPSARRLALTLALLAACAGDVTGGDDDDDASADASADASPDAPDATASGPDAASAGALLGSFQLTYYWVTVEDEFAGAPDTTIYDSDCAALATVAAAFFDSLRLEGTGRLADGRVLNYWGSCACPTSPCFFEVDADHPWGYGTMNRALVPLRSLAVDTDVLTIGDAYYIAELDGVTMPAEPDGAFAHDGCVVADDVGGGINGQHIDFFAALRANYLDLDGRLGLDAITLHEGGARCSAYALSPAP